MTRILTNIFTGVMVVMIVALVILAFKTWMKKKKKEVDAPPCECRLPHCAGRGSGVSFAPVLLPNKRPEPRANLPFAGCKTPWRHDMTFLLFLALLMGVCVTLQGALNATLVPRVGFGGGLVVNSTIVILCSLAVWVGMGQMDRLRWDNLAQIPWYGYLGGVCGFLIVLLAVLLIPLLGAGLTLSFAIAAQLLAAILLDHFGWLGMPEHPITLPRAIGCLLLLAGVIMVKFF